MRAKAVTMNQEIFWNFDGIFLVYLQFLWARFGLIQFLKFGNPFLFQKNPLGLNLFSQPMSFLSLPRLRPISLAWAGPSPLEPLTGGSIRQPAALLPRPAPCRSRTPPSPLSFLGVHTTPHTLATTLGINSCVDPRLMHPSRATLKNPSCAALFKFHRHH